MTSETPRPTVAPSTTDTEDHARVTAARLRALSDLSRTAVLMVDERLRVTTVNAAALHVLQVDADSTVLIGLTLTELARLADDSASAVFGIAIAFTERAVLGGVPVRDEEVHLPDGTVLAADYEPVVLDGVVRGHLMIGRDITCRAAARHALDVRDRELVDLAMVKNEFLATVAHELGTPLTAASSLLELIPGTGCGAEQYEIVNALRRNTERLRATVRDLMTLARLEVNQLPLDFRTVDPIAILAGCLTSARVGHTVPIVVANPPPGRSVSLTGDRAWLGRMLRELISCTLVRGGELLVRNEILSTSWTVTMLVTGPPDADERQLGVGFGETLARTIARRHGGDVRIEQDVDRLRILLTLPIEHDPNRTRVTTEDKQT